MGIYTCWQPQNAGAAVQALGIQKYVFYTYSQVTDPPPLLALPARNADIGDGQAFPLLRKENYVFPLSSSFIGKDINLKCAAQKYRERQLRGEVGINGEGIMLHEKFLQTQFHVNQNLQPLGFGVPCWERQ